MNPKPNLKTKNINKEYLKIAKEYVKEISSHQGVIGVAVGGGIGRGHSDVHSDIDLYIYLDSKTYKKWKKKAPIKEKCHRWKGYKLETYFIDYDKEIKSHDWIIEDRWERQHHFPLFDTKSRIKNLLSKKVSWRKGEKEELLDERLHRASWYIELPEDFISRGDVAQSHYLINVIINWIFDIVFLQNSYFIPWPKWKLHYVFLMKRKPKNFEKRIKNAMEIKSFSKNDVLRRVKILEKILKDLNKK
jgi:predicted nucleotidyltransferase